MKKNRFALKFVFIPFLLITYLVATHFKAAAQEAEPGTYKKKGFEQKVTQPVVKVLIKKIVVAGNTILSPAEVASVIHPWEGKDLSFNDAKVIAMRLTEAYRKKGYFLVQAYIPYQRIVNNTLQVNVLEGKLGTVTVEGNKHYSTKFILYNFAPATREKTLRYDTLEKSIMLLNEYPDLQVQTVLQPGKLPGTTDVVLKVTDKQPNHIDFDYNNFGTLTGGEHQPSLSPSFGNLVWGGDNLSLKGLWPFPSKSTTLLTPIVTANYSVPVNNHGTKINAGYSSSDVRLGQSLDVLNVFGNTSIENIGVSTPLARSESHSSNLSATFYIKSSTNFVLNSITSQDKIRSIALDYNTNWVSGTGSNLLDATITQGLGTLFNGSPNNSSVATTGVATSTPSAGNQFTKLNATLYRYQFFGSSGYFAILKATGQYALSPLVTPEQFIVGGSESVRGYRAAEASGDSGISGSIEFRFPLMNKPHSSVQFATFVDAARTNNRNVISGTYGVHHLTGVGFGFRYNSGDATAVRIDVGVPLDPVPNSTGENPVLYFDFSTRFL